MSDTQSPRKIAELLQSGMFQLEIQGLQKVESLLEKDPESACELLPVLVELGENSPHHQGRVTSIFDNLATEAPKEFATSPEVIDYLCIQIEEDPTDAGLTAIQILEPVSNQCPGELEREISADSIKEILDTGSPDERRAAYWIAGAILTSESLELLTSVSPYEHEEIREVADRSLRDAGRRLEKQIRHGNRMLDSRTLECIAVITQQHPGVFTNQIGQFTEILVDRRSKTAASIIQNVCRSRKQAAETAIDNLIESFDDSQTDQTGRIIGRTIGEVAASHTSVALDLADRFSQAILEEGGRVQSTWYVALNSVSSTIPNRIAQCAQVLCDTAEQEDASPLTRVNALRTLENLATAGEIEGIEIIDTLRRCASDPEKDVAAAAIRAFGELPLHPIPPELSAASKSSSKQLRNTAEAAIEQATARTDTYPLPEIPSSGSAVNYLIEQDALKYHQGGSIWRTPQPSGLQQSLFENLAAAFDAQEHGSVILPWHDSAYILPLAIEIGLQSVESQTKVVIFSPFYRGHGTFGTIRRQYRNYGLNPTAVESTAATPFNEVIGISRINEQTGTVDPYSTGVASCQLVLAKDQAEIRQLSNVSGVLANGIDWAKDELKNITEDLRETIDAPVYEVYSRVSREDHEHNYSRYWVPEVVEDQTPILPDQSAEVQVPDSGTPVKKTDSRGMLQKADPFRRAALQNARRSEGAIVQVKPVGDEEILEHLSKAHEIVDDLDEDRTESLYNSLRGAVYWTQNLIAPLETHNAWARTQTSLHGQFQPSTSSDLMNMIDQEVEAFSSIPFVEGAGFELKEELSDLFDLMAEGNPKFEALCEKISRVLDSDQTAGILFLKATRREPALKAICDRLNLQSSELESNGVYITNPDEIRDCEDLDITIVPNSLPRSMAGLYLLDNTVGTQVLTYKDSQDDRIQRHCNWYLNIVQSRCGAKTKSYWPNVRVEEIDNKHERASSNTAPEATTSDRTRLLDAVESNLIGNAGSSTTKGEVYQLNVRTTKNEEYTYDSTSRVLVPNSNGIEYAWKRVENLSVGDRFLRINPHLRSRLLSRLLEDSYENEIGEEFDLYKILEDWWAKIGEIESSETNMAEIHSRLRQAGLDREYSTVRNWVASAKTADEPLDLVENSDLVIGPESAEDIRIIGEVYDITEFQKQPEVIESVMAACRSFNRTKGREVSRLIKERLNTDKESALWKYVSEKEVAALESTAE